MMTRRRLIIGSAIVAPMMLILAYGCWEARQLQVVETTLAFPTLPAAFDGFRIVFVADLHTDRFGAVEKRLRQVLLDTPADLLVVGGDLKAHEDTPDKAVLTSCEQVFEGLHYPWGKVMVAGNHDTDSFLRRLAARTGIAYLERSSVLLEEDGARLAILGIRTSRPAEGGRGPHEIRESMWVGNMRRRSTPWRLLPDDLARPLTADRVSKGRTFRILLSHSPDAILGARERKVELVLAGDTHGGQVRLPLIGAVHVKSRLSRKYDRGHIVEGDTQMYVTPGIGTLAIPIRILCPPQVEVIVLRRRDHGKAPAREPEWEIGR
jgi:predicted MPP superfamily phosphohydrolase